MVASVEADFMSKFHSLIGTTMGERRKNLFLLLNKTKESLKAVSGEIDVSSLQPKTPLEENFKIEALLYFRNIPELLQVLKGGNPLLIERILNANSWFIEQAFENMSGEELVTQIFPYLSYNTKLKLVHKMSLYLKDTLKSNDYFEAIKKVYGVYLASKLLSACSDDLIMKCLESYRIEITPRQLLTIIKKYPTLTEDIFEKLHRYNCKIQVGEKYKYAFEYLAQHDVSLFLKLDEKYKPNIKLGTRATNKIICKDKQIILETPKSFYDFLKKKRIGKNLKGDFSKAYLKLFPKSLKRLEDHLDCHLDLLKYLSSDADRLKMLLMTFKAKHGSELWDHPTFITPKLIKMMSSDEREIWMQTHLRPNEISEEEWISFMKTEKSIPLLKEKISYTSKIKERAKLVGLLVETCKLNSDSSGLLDVCKYMVDKHRNDHTTVKQDFFNVLASAIDLLKLQDDHWKYINEFITLWKLKEGSFWTYSDIALKYIQYCFEENLPVKELLMEWSKLNGDYNIFQENPEYEKRCLLMFHELLPTAHKKENLESRYIQYLSALKQWNKRHPKDKFSLFVNDDAINYLISFLQKESYAYTEEGIAIACIFSDFEKSKKFNLLEVLLKRDNYYYRSSLITWIVKQQPLYLSDHTELVIENVLKMDNFCYFHGNFCRYYTHFEIPRKVSEICRKALNADDYAKIKAAATVLSHTMDSNEFLNLPALNPDNLAVEIKSDEGQKIYQLQQAIFPCLRNMIPPSLALATVLKFCRGDHLNLIQRALYSVAHNVPENELVPYFEVLSERAVSVRKHAIFLGFKVLDKAQSYKILTKFMETEKNASINKSLFKGIFNFFMRNPDDYSWELAKKSVNAVDVNDKEAFNILTKCRRIPSPYFVRYVIFAWGVLEEFQNPNDVIEEGMCRLLDAITADNISKLPKEFCEKIIEKYFLKSKKLSNIQLNIHSFVCKYIIYYTQGPEQEKSMESVFVTLKSYIESTWHDLNMSVVGRQTVSNFVKEFYSDFIEKKCHDKKIMNIFVTLWNDSLKPCKAFDEYLHLQFALIYLDCVNENLTVPQIGEKLAMLCDFLNNQGLLVMNIFCKSLDLFKSKFLSTNEESDEDENEIIMIESIVKTSKSPSCLALAISLLPKNILMVPSIKQKYDGIIELVMKESNPIVQIHLHHYMTYKE